MARGRSKKVRRRAGRVRGWPKLIQGSHTALQAHDTPRQRHFEGSLQEDEARRLEELEAWSKQIPHLEGSMQRLADHFDHILKNKLAAQKPPAP